MKTAEEIKEQYAKEHDYSNWEHCINDQPNWKVETIMDDISERFANAKAKALLEEAAEKAKVKKMDLNKWIDLKDMPEHPYEVDKESILSLIPKEQ